MQGVSFRVRSFLLAALVAAGGSCSHHDMTSTDVIEACHKDPASKCCRQSDCETGSICDFSVVCGIGADGLGCDPGMGDRQCHVTCDSTLPCTAGQTCAQKSLANFTDTLTNVSFCVAP